MTPEERELLVARVTSAHRDRSGRGEVRPSPAWHDLDEAGRREAHAATVSSRALEAAADPRGWSSTVRALRARLG
jgi:hypothetical protein